MVTKLVEQLRELGNEKKAVDMQRYFKTAKGEYAFGDIFWGISVPAIREIAKKYNSLNLSELEELIVSPIHEIRMCALFILVKQFQSAKKDPALQKEIYDFYLSHTQYINNWDLVDLSAYIVGTYLLDKSRKPLYDLAKSKNMWEQRIAIVSTIVFIRSNDLKDAFAISQILLNHRHDLIHKAVGWMLRECGKKDIEQLKQFLNANHSALARTTLRYAIEKFPQDERLQYLKK